MFISLSTANGFVNKGMLVGASYIGSLYYSDSLLAVSIRGQKLFGPNKLQVFLGNAVMDRFILFV